MVDLLVIEDIISLELYLLLSKLFCWCYLLILHWFTHRVFSGVTQSLALYVCFVDCCLSFCTFSFGHCVVCSSLIYDSNYPFGIFDRGLLDLFNISNIICIIKTNVLSPQT